jgi:hypothetical protein
MKLLTALMGLTIILAASAAQAAQCMQDNAAGQIAEGRLSKGMFEDAAGRPEDAYILTLPVPACLSGSDAESSVDSTTTIHVYSPDGAIPRQLEGSSDGTCTCAARPSPRTPRTITRRSSWR